MNLTGKDLLAIVLVGISVIVYGSQYAFEAYLGSFQQTYSWLALAIMLVTMLYLYVGYLRKK